MPQEELGYVELEWTCKNCGTRNPGSRKTCMNCGAAMGAQDKFALPAQQELIKDADTLAQAKQAPDVRCPFCGTLNPANARSCKQCGGDLQGAVARVQGGVLGAFDDSKQPDVKCPNCGTLNPASATKCSNCGATLSRPASPVATLPAAATLAPRVPAAGLNPLLIGAAVVLLLLCIGGGIWFITRTSESAATVSSLNWQRTIAIQALVPIQHADWQDQVPSDAQIKSCELKPRHYSDSPQPNSQKVCGTPYVLDQGNGTGKVVQDCQYLVSDQYCSYTRLEWSVVDTVVARGTDLNPRWPASNLQSQQREGNRAEEYSVVFTAGNQHYTYSPSTAAEFARYTPGSRWRLTLNGLGSIVKAEPLQ